MTLDLLRRVAALAVRKRELEAQLKAVSSEFSAASAQAVDYMAAQGMGNTNIDGVTLYIRNETWARLAEGVTPEVFAAVLGGAGIDPSGIVKTTANVQSLSALVRELGDDLPENLLAMLTITETPKLGTRT